MLGVYSLVADFDGMTKNSNQGFFFSGILFVGGGAGSVGAGQGSGTGQGEAVRAIIPISDTLYYPYTHCCKFSSRYSMRLPCYCLHKSLSNL